MTQLAEDIETLRRFIDPDCVIEGALDRILTALSPLAELTEEERALVLSYARTDADNAEWAWRNKHDPGTAGHTAASAYRKLVRSLEALRG